jgi:hypothetical protein
MGLLLHTMAEPKLAPEGALELAARLRFDGVRLLAEGDLTPTG